MSTLQTYLSEIEVYMNLKNLIFTFYTGSLHMTSCAKVVNNISQNFILCDF